MAFCQYCGKELAEGEVCDCRPQAPKKEKKPIKWSVTLSISTPIFVLIIALIVIFKVFGAGNYETPMKNIVKAFNKGETDAVTMLSLSAPKSLQKEMKSFFKTFSVIEDIQEDLEDEVEDNEDYFSSLDDDYDKWKFSFTASRKKKIKSKDIDDLEDELKSYYKNYLDYRIDDLEDYDSDDYEDLADNADISEKEAKKIVKSLIALYKYFDDIEIKNAYEVTGRFYLDDGDEEIAKTEKVTFIVAKINGSWTILRTDDYSNIYIDNSSEDYSAMQQFASIVNESMFENIIYNLAYMN